MSGQTVTAQEVDQLFAALKQNGPMQEDKDLSGVLGYIALMEKQLAALNEELRGVRQELSKLKEPSPIMAAWQKLAADLQKQIAAIRERLVAVKDTIKHAGITALDGAARFLHVKTEIQSIGTDLKHAAKGADTTRKKVAAATARYHDAGKHLRNFGRALRGKEPLAEPKPEGALSQGTQAFFSGVHIVLAGAARDADKAVALLDRLEMAAAKSKEQRASVKENLRELKAGLPPPKAPELQQNRQTDRD